MTPITNLCKNIVRCVAFWAPLVTFTWNSCLIIYILAGGWWLISAAATHSIACTFDKQDNHGDTLTLDRQNRSPRYKFSHDAESTILSLADIWRCMHIPRDLHERLSVWHHLSAKWSPENTFIANHYHCRQVRPTRFNIRIHRRHNAASIYPPYCWELLYTIIAKQFILRMQRKYFKSFT